jgi:hypothetical protein
MLETGAGVEFKRQSRSQRLEPLPVNEEARGVAAGDLRFAVDLEVVLMDVAVSR